MRPIWAQAVAQHRSDTHWPPMWIFWSVIDNQIFYMGNTEELNVNKACLFRTSTNGWQRNCPDHDIIEVRWSQLGEWVYPLNTTAANDGYGRDLNATY